MTVDEVTLILRILLVVFLYLFLMQIVFVAGRDLRRSSMRASTVAIEPQFAQPSLVVTESRSPGVPAGTTYLLEPHSTIGREEGRTVALDDTFVSSTHFRIDQEDDAWILTDEKSTNGTIVNGAPIRGRVRLNRGDVIQLGSISLRFFT